MIFNACRRNADIYREFVRALKAAGPGEAVMVPPQLSKKSVRAAFDFVARTKEPAVFHTDGPRADLAVAYPLSDDVIGFTLTVAGKPQQFTMKRSAAASFIGRMAEVLAK